MSALTPLSFSRAVGRILRTVRRAQKLTLRDVEQRSGGRFKPSALGSYERGERLLSIERFLDLATFYGVPADRLLAQALAAVLPDGRREIVLNIKRLSLVAEPERGSVSRFVDLVSSQRGGTAGEMISLRAGDVEELALQTGENVQIFIERIHAAVEDSN